MSEVNIKFKLPEEENEFKLAQRGIDYFCVIQDTLRQIRAYLKHGHSFQSVEEALEEIQTQLYNAPIEDIE